MANPDAIRRALLAILTKTSDDIPIGGGIKPRPIGKGEDTQPFDGLTDEAAMGFANVDEVAEDLSLGATISPSEKQAFKSKYIEGDKKTTRQILDDRKALREFTTEQQSGKAIEDPAGEKMTLDKILDDEVIKSSEHRTKKGKPGTKGPLARGLRDPEDLDLEGEALTREKERLQLEVLGGRNDISDDVKAFGQGVSINNYIQDVFKRFNDTFDEPFKIEGKSYSYKQAKQQGSFGSQLRDKHKALAKLAENARNPNLSDTDKANMLKKVTEIDNWVSDSNVKLQELGDAKQAAINPDEILPASNKQMNEADELVDEAIAPAQADVEFSRTPSELSQQRKTLSQQGPGGKVLSVDNRKPPPKFIPPAGPLTGPGVSYKLSGEQVLLNTLIDMLNTRGK